MILQRFRIGIVLTALLIAGSASAELEEIKEPLFAEATKALRQANEARGALLAPRSYAEAASCTAARTGR